MAITQDLYIWQMEKAKITKKGSRSYFFSSCKLLTEISIYQAIQLNIYERAKEAYLACIPQLDI